MLAVDGFKRCSNGDCGIKSVDDFYKCKSKADGLNTYCKACLDERKRASYAKDGRRKRVSAVSRTWRQRNPEKMAAHRRKEKYGLTESQYQGMVASQRGLCGSCGERKRLVVDHNHNTGKVRALLCHGCNVALGYLKDDVSLCYKLAEYAASHGPRIVLEVR